MAELVLLADPTEIRFLSDGTSLAVEFASIADLKSWLRLAGLNDPDMLTAEYDNTTTDGRAYRQMNAYPTWHGWKVYAYATEYTDTTGPLDSSTADRLAALAVA
ncbi:hypothetical protein AB0M91_17705 [Micromonospora rifamycinica]|uniref:hypothetical protein n=1 Tax=Micromonospora rifamycinica TaxID=291594 RepID=UPI0034234A9E